MGLLEPRALGDGYPLIQDAIAGELGGLLGALGLLLGLKVLASSFSLGSGAPGGVFAPSLVLGAVAGVLFHRLVAPLVPTGELAPVGSVALAGMGGLIAATLQAPRTGILLVMEVTGGYGASLALMTTSVAAVLVARRFEPHSFYMRTLRESGDLLRPGTDQRILADVRVRECLDGEVVPVREAMTLAQLVRAARRTSRNHFPVLDEDGGLVGMLELSSVRELLLDPELAQVTLVGTVMVEQADVLPADADLPRPRLDALGACAAGHRGRRFLVVAASTLFGIYWNELRMHLEE